MPDARVVFLGDELLLCCREQAAAILRNDGLTVVGPDASLGAAADIAECAARVIDLHQPDIALLVCSPYGFENTPAAARGEVPLSLSDFERTLISLSQTIPRFCGSQVACTTIPPIHIERLGVGIASPDGAAGFQRQIDQFNQLALNIFGEFNIFVRPIHENVARYIDDDLAADGFRLTPSGISRYAAEFAAAVYEAL